MSMLRKIEKLRAEAFAEALASPALTTVRALDEAVVSAGGVSILGKPLGDSVKPMVSSRNNAVAQKFSTKKVPQGDAALQALEEEGPLPIGRLLEASEKRGAVFRGEKPLPSFRSTLSKDDRFYSLNRNNMFFWWISGRDLPVGFMPEPAEGGLLLGSGQNSSEEGGDTYAATVT